MRSVFSADATSRGSDVPMYCAIFGLALCAPSGSVAATASATSSLFRIELSPCVQVVEVQDRVEHQEVAPDGLAAVHGVVAEEHDVPLFHRHVHHHGTLRDVRTDVEQAGHEEIPLVAEAQDYARALVGRNDVERVAQLIVRHGRILPRLHRSAWC